MVIMVTLLEYAPHKIPNSLTFLHITGLLVLLTRNKKLLGLHFPQKKGQKKAFIYIRKTIIKVTHSYLNTLGSSLKNDEQTG